MAGEEGEVLPEKPDYDNTAFGLRMLMGLGAVALAFSLFMAFTELGKPSGVNSLGLTTGPNAQSLFISAVVGTAGAVLAVWARRKLKSLGGGEE